MARPGQARVFVLFADVCVILEVCVEPLTDIGVHTIGRETVSDSDLMLYTHISTFI